MSDLNNTLSKLEKETPTFCRKKEMNKIMPLSLCVSARLMHHANDERTQSGGHVRDRCDLLRQSERLHDF